jgi:hypothetical protein
MNTFFITFYLLQFAVIVSSRNLIELLGCIDEHNCNKCAGYTWCEPLKLCVQPWQTYCQSIDFAIESDLYPYDF